jgi:integrase
VIARILFGAAPEAALPALRAEALRLAKVALREDATHLQSLEARLGLLCPLEDGQGDTDGEAPALEAIHRDLRARGLIGRAPFAAVLSAPLARDDRQEIADALGGWLVVAALERPLAEGLESLVVTACDAVRLLKRIDAALLEAFDLRAAGSLKEACETLRSVEVEAEAEAGRGGRGSRRLANRLRPVRALLEAAERDRAPIAREAAPRGVRAARRGRAPSGLDLLLDEDDAGTPADLSADALPDRLDPPATTTAADAPLTGGDVTRQVRSYDGRGRDRLRTRAIAAAAAMRDLELPASADLLTDHEARVLIGAARAAPEDAGMGALALSLVTGRSVDRLVEALEADPVRLLPEGAPPPREAWDLSRAGTAVLEVAVDLPDFSVELPRTLGRSLSSDGRERLRLAMPPSLGPDVLMGLDAQACDRAMKGLRSRVARPYARSRIAGWLGAWLRGRGADPAAIGALTGRDPGGRAQMHYTRLATGDLAALWEAALTEGLGIKAPPRPRSSPELGARLRLPEAALARTFAALGRRIDRDRDREEDGTARDMGRGSRRGRRVRPLAGIAAAHERFALYTLELLGMATGHRPVDAPFERLDDLDLETGLAGLADKAPAGGRSERIVALPPSAVAQLGHWLAHLRALHAAIAWRVAPEVGTRIAAALGTGARGAPLFFFLTPEGGIVEPRRREIVARRRAVLPVQANLARHMLRTRLVAAGVAPDAVDASLGHARLGEEPWGAFSTLSVGDLRAVAEAAEELLGALALDPRPGPLDGGPGAAPRGPVP